MYDVRPAGAGVSTHTALTNATALEPAGGPAELAEVLAELR
jgi:predicted protein tyrosine phosphatase